MFNKFLLLEQITEMLKRKDFDVFVTSGCFDIAARRGYLLLLKVLFNADCISQESAFSLKSLAYFLSAYPFIVAYRCTKFKLQDNTVYNRFSVAVITPQTLESIIDSMSSAVIASKGKHVVEIDTELLRRKRLENKYTLEDMAKRIGISKKALYEIEHKRVNPKVEHVEKMEKLLNTKLRVNLRFDQSQPVYLEPKDNFEREVIKEFKRMEIETSPVRASIFNIVGREERVFTTALYEDEEKVLKSLQHFREMSAVTLSKVLFVVQQYRKRCLDGLPVVSKEELKETSRKDLKKIVESSWV